LKGKRRRPQEDEKNKYRVNEQIRAREVRVVGDHIEESVYTREDALKLADEHGLDLVEIYSKGDPPVCKLVDFGKFVYEQRKKQKELKQKSAKVDVKEIRFTPNTDDHDFNFKVNHAKNFLKDGNKVKAFVHFKGRAIVHKERGELLLLNFAKELEDYGKIEQLPKLEGKRMIIFMNPVAQKNKPKPKN
jgi:translation initiation factor IF-3